MAAFGVVAYKILSIFEGNFFWRPDIYDDPDFTRTWGWTKGEKWKEYNFFKISSSQKMGILDRNRMVFDMHM